MDKEKLKEIQDVLSLMINDTDSGYNYTKNSMLLLEKLVEFKKLTPEKISVALYYS